jgi:hypothetical protein
LVSPTSLPAPSSILPPIFLAVPDTRFSSMAMLLLMIGRATVFDQRCNVVSSGRFRTNRLCAVAVRIVD